MTRLRIPLVIGLALAAWGEARALEPLNVTPPLVAPAAPSPSAGQEALLLTAAQRAQEMGFPSAAEALYRQVLDASPADRHGAILGLATALIDQGRGADAEKALDTWVGVRDAAWHLRRGLAALLQGFVTTARNERDAAKFGELSPADRAWHLYLQGSIAIAENESDKAVALLNQAVEAAVGSSARARLLLKREESRLRSSTPVNAAELERLRKSMEQFQGRSVGYGFTRSYALMLDALGRKAEAVRALQQLLVALPPEERADIDETRLLLGLVAGASSGEGRDALDRLLEKGIDPDKQRVALELLAGASLQNPALAAFRRRLDAWIAVKPPHPILEDLLLHRAQAALAVKNSESYARAEDDARTLLQKFPGSPLRAHAFGVLTEAAWEQRRYRTAADNAVKARAELPPGAQRSALGVLVAEAWFRARDFRSAADTYAAVLLELPPGPERGRLMFQRVLAESEAGAPEAAVKVLDELVGDASFDAVSRWQAEWNLARALQVAGQTTQAYARVTKLLATPASELEKLPAELRARMAWLQARLASAAGRPEEALTLLDTLPAALAEVAPQLREAIASSAALLRGEANFALGRDAVALEVMKKLRADFPRSDAAVYSYFDEADYYAKQDNAVEAQKKLTTVADDFADNRTYAPLALYRAALQAERRGQEANYKEANRLIEALVARYPESDLVFSARLKQGDLFRKLNDFASAQRAYQDLLNRYPQRPDIALAQLALAETHNAQSMNEPAHTESALVLFEEVRDRIDAPLDARVEAGFNLGWLHLRRNESVKAERVWWADVVNEFLLKPETAAKLGVSGRYWMARTLLELGSLYEQQEKLEQAKGAWLLIGEARLGYGETLAKARLARFGLGEAKP